MQLLGLSNNVINDFYRSRSSTRAVCYLRPRYRRLSRKTSFRAPCSSGSPATPS
nr:MAG TPA: hypothetical protein [Caudoviricetes sp.]